MKTFKQDMEEFLANPENRKVYESLEVEFAIHRALVNERIQKKLTQKQLAKKLGIAQSALARLESGRSNPTLSFLQKVTSALGLRLTVI